MPAPASHCVLTLIAPTAGALTGAIVAPAMAALNGLGAKVGDADWLAPEEACDVPFVGVAAGAAGAALRRVLGGLPVDICIGPADRRRKWLLVADMDSTIVAAETLDELAAAAGKKREIAAITAHAMAGDIEFADALKQRVAMLKGVSEGALADTLAQVRLTPGAETLVRTMAAAGAYTVLVSGGCRYFTERIARRLGFDTERGNRFETAAGRLTGRVGEPILDKHAKRRALVETAQSRGIPIERTLAVGDGANDVPMLEAAGLGVAYRARPVLANAADARIEHGDLTAVLFMQGYRRAEFAA